MSACTQIFVEPMQYFPNFVIIKIGKISISLPLVSVYSLI